MTKLPKHDIDIGVLRVSSFKQGLAGDSPDEQKEAITAKRIEEGRDNVPINWLELIESASGDNQPFKKVLTECNNPQFNIQRVYIKVIDRMTRGGAEYYIPFKKQLIQKNIQLIDVAGVISSKQVNTLAHITAKEYRWSVYNPTEKNELLQAETAKEEVRTILTRLIGAEIRYVKMGYWTGPAPLGFKSKKIDTPEHGKRTILEPDEMEARWFEPIFTLRAQGKPDPDIVNQVNAMGFRTRQRNIYDKEYRNKVIGRHPGKPLTVRSLRTYIRRPIYAGINTNTWLEGKPIKGRFKGIVSIDIFNRANKGKLMIVEDGGRVGIYKGKVPSYLLKKSKFNPNFPYKDQVLCPRCKEKFYASTSQGRGGYYPAYHHGSKQGKHVYLRILSKDFHKTIKEFVQEVKFTDEFLMYLHKYILEEWELRRNTTLEKNITLGQRLTSIEQEQKMYGEKIPVLNSPAAIKILEDKIEELETEKEAVMIEKAKRQKEGLDIQKIIRYSWYFFEHVEELVLGGSNPQTNAMLFGLLFDEKPTYDDLVFRTPKLACVFKLNEQYNNAKNTISEAPGTRTLNQQLKRLLLYQLS